MIDVGDQFEQMVDEGIAAIAPQFRQALDNVSIVIEDEPSAEQLLKLQMRPGHTLFGLYEGVPLSKRGSGYSLVLPDKITIFRQPIQQASRNASDVRRIVRQTIWHEIGHHFGMDEAQVRQAERKRLINGK